MHWSSRLTKIVGWTFAVLVLCYILVGFFPYGVLRGTVERRASERFGRPVTLGALRRLDTFGYHPTIALERIRVPQAAWAGTGDLAQVSSVTMTLSVWQLLFGRVAPEEVQADGVRLTLVRDKDGRTNWSNGRTGDGGDGHSVLTGLTVSDTMITYVDAKQDRRFRIRVAADPRSGVTGRGEGFVRGHPVRLTMTGPAVGPAGPWPFRAMIAGDALTMRAVGTMDRPLDTGAMTLSIAARANDLKDVDAIIEAGLFHTRPVTIQAQVRRDPDTWTIGRLSGMIGRSDFAGRLVVRKKEGRSKIDGQIDSRRLAFDDLSSAEGRAAAQALEARIGPRLVPNTRIDIGAIDTTDGRLAFRVRSIIGEDADTVINMRGVMTLDHQLLTLSPLRMRIAQGVVTGKAVVDQRGGRATPVLSLDLRLDNGRAMTFAAGGQITGRIAARARLRGSGDTIRAAVGRSTGSIGFVARDGSLPAKYAAALGFDAGRALLAGNGERAALRCLVARLDMRDGTGRSDPAIIDTALSQLRGSGTVSFPDERLSFDLHGAPKGEALLRIPGTVALSGTLQDPHIVIPPKVKSVGNILRAIGDRIGGKRGPIATDANCAALTTVALR